MAGEVYGEEHFPIDVSKGLWISPAPDSIPEGHCQKLTNMFRNERGNWEMRKGFKYEAPTLLADSSVETGFEAFADWPIPELVNYKVVFGELYGGFQTPQLFLAYTAIPGPHQGRMIHLTGRRNSTDTVNA